MRRAAFLDRDGTINAMVRQADHDGVDSPATAEVFTLLPGAAQAIRLLNQTGLMAIVVSNQPGIAKGRFTYHQLDAQTRKMHEELAQLGARLDAVFYCLHHPRALLDEFRQACSCRKPRLGLLVQAAGALGIDLRHSHMIGDTITDVQAGASAGCTTIWLDGRSPGTRRETAREAPTPDRAAPSLLAAVDFILRGEGEHGGLSRHCPTSKKPRRRGRTL